MERDLIARIAERIAVRPGVRVGLGDDAAVLDTDPVLVVSTDMLVDGRHFRRARTSLPDLGHKALAVSLSDIAAMGALPVAAVVALGVPDGADAAEDLSALYAGMETLAATHGCTVAGGDITGAPALTLAVTVIGRMDRGVAPLLRSGARPGDLVAVTGALGAGAAGVVLLDRPELSPPVAERSALEAAQLRPTPRLAAGRALAAGGAHACLDISDGLGIDADRMALASGVRIDVDLARVPVAPGVATVARGLGMPPAVFAATAGDDYELLVAVPPGLTAAVPLTVVGRVAAGPPGVRLLDDGREIHPPSLGWEHPLA